jgi:general secretion pathway protein H
MPRISATGKRAPAVKPVELLACRKPGGFTLLEVMVVLAILAAGVMLIPLSISHSMPGRRVAATAEHISNAIADAQSDSLALGLPMRVEVQPGSLLIAAMSDTGSIATFTRRLRIAAATHVRLVAPNGQPLAALVVYSDGATSGGRFEIVDGTRRAVLSVSALTGRIQIRQGS